MTDPAIEFIGVAEVAKLLHIATTTLYNKVHRGEIPYYKPGGKLLFKEVEIVAEVEKSRVQKNPANR